MKKTLLTIIATFLLSAPLFGGMQQVPTKAFDVREANGIVDTGTTYPAAIVIPFKDLAAETTFYNDYANNNNWANANPQPTKKAFALAGIKQFMKDQSTQGRNKVVVVPVPDTTDLP